MVKRILVTVLLICLVIATACTKKQSEEIDMQKVYDETPATELMLGLWVTPGCSSYDNTRGCKCKIC